jgi:hypothetical protein
MTNALGRPLGLLLLLGGAILPGCAAQQTTATGFLAQAPQEAPLAATAEDPETRLFVADAAALRGFRAVMIEDVAFRPGPAVPAVIDQAVVDDLRTSFRQSLSAAFAARGYRLVATPVSEGGTLRLRAAVTGYERANVALNLATTVLGAPVTAGGAASETEVLDEATGTRLVAQATHSNGTPLLGGPHNYYREHGHARAALDRHARDLAARMPPAATNWASR